MVIALATSALADISDYESMHKRLADVLGSRVQADAAYGKRVATDPWIRWANQPMLISPIVGTWRLTSFTEQNLETGAISYPFGEGAKALVIYGANGYVATIFAAAPEFWTAG
jgi:Lipocalin-like domain